VKCTVCGLRCCLCWHHIFVVALGDRQDSHGRAFVADVRVQLTQKKEMRLDLDQDETGDVSWIEYAASADQIAGLDMSTT
jgi:hypothetical protein